MIKILPTMSTDQAAVEVKILDVPVSGEPGGGGGGSRPRTDLKRRSADDSEGKGKRRRGRPSLKSLRRKRRETLTNNAPFNSTQFLMSDHGGDTIQYLDTTLGVTKGQAKPNEIPVRRVTRARESSFSLDSDEDFYYSSPEDEEEFVSQEFIKEYNNVRTDRLVDMAKSDLIQEYLQMEQRVDSLEKRLNRHKGKSATAEKEEESDSSSDSESKETTEQIRLFQKEILRLEAENERLRSANVVILQQRKSAANSEDGNSSCCSTCSSSCSSSEDSSSEEEEDVAALPAPKAAVETTKAVDNNEREDVGYESSQSSKAKDNEVIKGEVSSSTN